MDDLTPSQRSALAWLVDRANAGDIDGEEFYLGWTKNGFYVAEYSKEDTPRDIKRSTIERLELLEYITVRSIGEQNYFRCYLERRAYEVFSRDNTQSKATEKNKAMAEPSKVAVIHGRNNNVKKSMFDLLYSLGLKPVDWTTATKRTGKGSPHHVDILNELLVDVTAAVVLLTPDDKVVLREEFQEDNDPEYEKRMMGQSRPNVLYEAGLAFAKLPNHTIVVEVGQLRPFSDMAGVSTIRIKDTTEKKDAVNRYLLAERLRTVGCVFQEDPGFLEAGDFWIEEEGEILGLSQAETTIHSINDEHVLQLEMLRVINNTEKGLRCVLDNIGTSVYQLTLHGQGVRVDLAPPARKGTWHTGHAILDVKLDPPQKGKLGPIVSWNFVAVYTNKKSRRQSTAYRVFTGSTEGFWIREIETVGGDHPNLLDELNNPPSN